MIGKTAQVIKDFDEIGQVECDGTAYLAISSEPLKAKQKVVIKGVDGIKLIVKPVS